MNTFKLDEFINSVQKDLENKTDVYWMSQADFQFNDEKNIDIIVSSEFIKSSIEKKVLPTITKKLSNLKTSIDCVFVVDKNFKKDFLFEEKLTPSVQTTKDVEESNEINFDLEQFDDLIVGNCNNLAITAAKNVVVDPGNRFNPLFVYGKPGVGKTYLLKTIEKASKSSYYIDSESFLESYISGIKNQDIESFKNKIRSVDILLIDDIQFFLGKKGVSEELFHTINYFLNNSKAVILASDQKPQSLIGFPERLVSRILNGLVTDIEKPDKFIFSEILNEKNLEFNNALVSKKDIDLLLKLDFQSFREINGVINNLIINKQTGTGNAGYIAELVSMYSDDKIVELTPEFILEYCSNVYQVDKKLIVSKNRGELVSNARHLFIYLMRKHTEYSLNQIGLYVGNRSHSTVLSSIKKVENSQNLKKEINIFNNKVNLINSKIMAV